MRPSHIRSSPSHAGWRDPAHADVLEKLRESGESQQRQNLWFPQVMRDARRIGDYYPGLSPESPESMDRLGVSLTHLDSRCRKNVGVRSFVFF